MPVRRRRDRRDRRVTSPWRSRTACTVLIAGQCTSGQRCRSRSRIFGAPQLGYSRLILTIGLLNDHRQLIRVAMRSSAAIGEALHPDLPVPLVNLVAGLPGNPELLA